MSAWESTRLSEVCPSPRFGRVRDARERAGVLRVGEERQVGHRVPDLRPLVELRAADDLVADLRAHEHVLQHPRLRVGPVEDGDLLAADALVDHPLDLGGDVARLGVLVAQLPDLDRVALTDLGPQRLRHPPPVVRHDPVGGGEDGLRRAVVLLELDDVGVDEVVLKIEDVLHVRASKGVDAVVGHEPAGDEVVRVLDIEVVDRPVEWDLRDALDDVVAAVLGEHDHAAAHVLGGGERECAGAQPRHRPDRRGSRALDSLDDRHRLAEVLEARFVAPARGTRLGGPDGEPGVFERRPHLGVASADGHQVHRRAPTPVAAEGYRDVAAPALEPARDVVRMLERQSVAAEQLTPALLGVQAREQAVDPALVADDAVRALGARPGGERERRYPEHQRELGFLEPRLRLDVMRRDHPGGVGVLLHRAQGDATDRELRLRLVDLARSHPEALAAAIHEVGQVHGRRVTTLEACEVDVLRGRDDAPAAARGDLGSPPLLGDEPVGHARGPEVAAPVAREHLVADLHVLDRLDRSVPHRDRGALDQALVVVPDDREVAVL